MFVPRLLPIVSALPANVHGTVHYLVNYNYHFWTVNVATGEKRQRQAAAGNPDEAAADGGGADPCPIQEMCQNTDGSSVLVR